MPDNLSSNAKCFADDTFIFSVVQDVHTSTEELQDDLKRIMNGLSNRKFVITEIHHGSTKIWKYQFKRKMQHLKTIVIAVVASIWKVALKCLYISLNSSIEFAKKYYHEIAKRVT